MIDNLLARIDSLQRRVAHLEALEEAAGLCVMALTPASIQPALDAVIAAGGGTVCLAPITYDMTGMGRLEIYDCNNVMLQGAGIGQTALDWSGVDSVSAVHAIAGANGLIIIGPTGAHAALEDCAVRDMTIKGKADASGDYKIISTCATTRCHIERVKVIGSKKEAITCDPYFGTGGRITKEWVVRDCEVEGCLMNCVNGNSTHILGIMVQGCYLHDSDCGANLIGYDVDCHDNHFDALGLGLICSAEGAGTFMSRMDLHDNIFTNIGVNEETYHHFAIDACANGPDISTHHGLRIADNIIGPMHTITGWVAYGIRARGLWTIDGNMLCGVDGADDGAGIAILIGKDAAGGTAEQDVKNNTIEAVDSDHRYSFGIGIENDAHVRANVIGNTVQPNAILTHVEYIESAAYYDIRGASTVDGCVFNGPIRIGGTWYNTDASLNGKAIRHNYHDI